MRFGKGKSVRPRTPWCRTKRSNPASEDEPLRKRRAATEGFVIFMSADAAGLFRSRCPPRRKLANAQHDLLARRTARGILKRRDLQHRFAHGVARVRARPRSAQRRRSLRGCRPPRIRELFPEMIEQLHRRHRRLESLRHRRHLRTDRTGSAATDGVHWRAKRILERRHRDARRLTSDEDDAIGHLTAAAEVLHRHDDPGRTRGVWKRDHSQRLAHVTELRARTFRHRARRRTESPPSRCVRRRRVCPSELWLFALVLCFDLHGIERSRHHDRGRRRRRHRPDDARATGHEQEWLQCGGATLPTKNSVPLGPPTYGWTSASTSSRGSIVAVSGAACALAVARRMTRKSTAGITRGAFNKSFIIARSASRR